MTKFEYGKMIGEVLREPVEISFVMKDNQWRGPFVANRDQRGIALSDNQHQICLTNDEALMLLTWLREQEATLHAMVDEEAEKLADLERRQRPADTIAPGRPSQAEGDLETIEANLRERENNV